MTDTDPDHLPGTGVALDAVAEIMSTSQAARPAVILDCGYAAIATTRFTGTAPAPSLMAFAARGAQDPALEEVLLRSVLEGVVFKAAVYPDHYPIDRLRCRLYDIYGLPTPAAPLCQADPPPGAACVRALRPTGRRSSAMSGSPGPGGVPVGSPGHTGPCPEVESMAACTASSSAARPRACSHSAAV